MTSCSSSVNTNPTCKFKMQIKRIQTEQEANLSSLHTYKSPIIALVVSRLLPSSVVCRENANYHLWHRKTATEVGVFHAYCYQPASNQSSRKEVFASRWWNIYYALALAIHLHPPSEATCQLVKDYSLLPHNQKLQTSSKDCVTIPREPKLGLIMAIIDGKIVSMIVIYRWPFQK